MHWSTVLEEAAEKFDGGPRSFPAASDAEFARGYAYEAPNEDYQKLFWRQATVSGSQQNASFCPHSAGWLIPDEDSVCNPVFVAHSLRSALWLLRKTLPENTLPDDGWSRLVRGAESLAQDERREPPPSAQKPSASLSPQASALSQQQKKRPSPSAPASTPKRARTESDGTLSITSPPSETDRDRQLAEQPEDPPRHKTTVSNNNRRADRERSRRLERSRAKNRIGLGLVEPGDGAAAKEKAAYTTITQQDASTVAWIIKQPTSDKMDFYTSTKTPYLTAGTLLEKVRVLGNPSSLRHAAQFLQAWRQRGSAFRTAGELAGSQARIGAVARRQDLPCERDEVDRDFCFAYNMCIRCDTDMAAIHIETRWAAALLGQAYVKKIAQIRHVDSLASKDTRNRHGRGFVRTEAIAALVELARPRESRDAFRQRLNQSMRWYSLAQELGWGILMLVPHDRIANRWIERTLRVGQLAVWMDLVKRERQEIYAASKALESWLGPEGIAGGPISGKQTLSIEAEAPATIYEVQDSEDDGTDDETDGSVDDSVDEHAQASPTPAPASRLRQLTLPELFHPIADIPRS